MGFGTWAAKFEKFANGLKIKNFRKKTGVFRTGTNCNWWTAKEPKKGVLTAARTYYYPYCPFMWVPPPRGFSLISLKLQGLYPHKPLQLKYTTWTSPIKLCDWGGLWIRTGTLVGIYLTVKFIHTFSPIGPQTGWPILFFLSLAYDHGHSIAWLSVQVVLLLWAIRVMFYTFWMNRTLRAGTLWNFTLITSQRMLSAYFTFWSGMHDFGRSGRFKFQSPYWLNLYKMGYTHGRVRGSSISLMVFSIILLALFLGCSNSCRYETVSLYSPIWTSLAVSHRLPWTS